MNRWWAAAAVGAILGLGTLAWNIDDAWTMRRVTIERREATRASLLRVRSELQAERERFAQGEREQRRTTASLDGAALSVDQRQAELAAIGAARDQISGLRERLGAEATIVRQCLAGAGTALDAIGAGQSKAAGDALRFVDAVCRATLATQNGADAQYTFDFPDPFVLVEGNTWYTYATNASAGAVQVLRRSGNEPWQTAGNGLAALPKWAKAGATWAPAVIARPGGYVMYYTARFAFTGVQCISRAWASTPTGPFIDASTEPLECGESGAIDPEPALAPDGTLVLLWKRERPATLMARPLRADGLDFAGEPVALMGASKRWQGGNVEAPSMIVDTTGAWLFYAANDWNGAKYVTGVVRCRSILGPCDDAAAGPLLASKTPVMGPGGASAFRAGPGDVRLAYHGYVAPDVGYPASRLLFIGRIDLSSGRPVVVP